MEAKGHIADLIENGRKAMDLAKDLTQEEVDRLVCAIGYEFYHNQELVETLANMALEETQLGDLGSKIAKVKGKSRGMWYDLKNAKSVGITEEIQEKGLVKISKPVGVIASLVPSTQPEMHPMIQSMNSVKAKDAIIFSPHPRGKKTTFKTVEAIRDILARYGAPKDLVQCIEDPSMEKTQELMKQSDLVIATGGQPMVRSAYSSGTPAYGVGAGNANIVIDETADLKDAAEKIKNSKTFDLAAGCSCDNAVLIQESVYEEMLDAFQDVGGYMLNSEEKARLQSTLWPKFPESHALNADIVAKPVQHIADAAQIEIPEGTKFLLVEEEGSGADYPFSGEKLSLVIAIYKFADIDEAIRKVNANQAYSGAGHSCGIYSSDPDNIDKYSQETFTTRVTVNLPNALTNTGSWVSGLPATSSLGCGTWGGNICSENIELKHYLNNTWVIREIPSFEPSDEALWEDFEPVK